MLLDSAVLDCCFFPVLATTMENGSIKVFFAKQQEFIIWSNARAELGVDC